MTENNPNPSNSPSTKQLLIGGGVAVVVAAVILVLFVLPAEFGVDPAGTGEATGLSGLADAGEMTELERGEARMAQEVNVLSLTDEAMHTERWTRVLRPYESVEFKFTLAEGEPMVFSWQADGGPLEFDMHAHPFEGGVELTESYSVASGEGQQGLYLAPFTGIHGWYWQNRTLEDVTLTVNAAGGFTTTTVFDEAGEQERPAELVD